MVAATEKVDLVTRRDAIRRVSVMLGGAALVGQAAWLAGCEGQRYGSGAGGEPFSSLGIELLDEIADTILPTTTTPGAKAARVGAFIATMVTDTYDPREQRIFRLGLDTFDRECRSELGMGFLAAAPAPRRTLLERLDREQFEYTRRRGPGGDPHYFRMIKELTLLGYFTSETGYTQAQRYAETPGRFDPCVPYAPGDKAWAPHA